MTKEQLNEGLRDRYNCGLRLEEIKRKLLSADYTFQEAVDAAIAHEAAQRDVRDLGSNPLGENSSASVDKVKRDHFLSRGRTPACGQPHGKNRNQSQRTGDQQKRFFRCGLSDHTPHTCKYKNSECFQCHLKGHLQSECRTEDSTSGMQIRILRLKC